MAVLGMGTAPSRVSFDPEVMREIRVYSQREDADDGHNVVAPELPLDGIVGIAQPYPHYGDGQSADNVAQHITSYLQEHHDPLNPEHVMHDAFTSANKQAASAYRAGVMATFARFYPKKEGSKKLAGVYGSIGDVPLYALVEKGIFKKRLHIERINPTPEEAGKALTGAEVDEKHIVTGAIKLRQGTRYLMTSAGAGRHGANVDIYGSLTHDMSSQTIADTLAQSGGTREGDRVTKVIEIDRKRRRLAAPAGATALGAAAGGAGAAAAANPNAVPPARGVKSPEQRRKRRRNALIIGIGTLALGGILAGLTALGISGSDRANHAPASPSRSASASPSASHSPSAGPSGAPSGGSNTPPSSGSQTGGGGTGGEGGGPESPAPVGQPAGAPFVVGGGSSFTEEITQYAATQGKVITLDTGFKIYLDAESHVQPNNMIVVPGGDSGTYKMPDGHYGISEPTRDAHWTVAMKRIIDADLAAA